MGRPNRFRSCHSERSEESYCSAQGKLREESFTSFRTSLERFLPEPALSEAEGVEMTTLFGRLL